MDPTPEPVLPKDVHVRRRMQTQRRVSTKPETRIRQIIYHRGLRYRVAYKVPGFPRRSIDIAFPGPKVAVFIDGCFWHMCPEHYVVVKNNAAWWEQKLAANVARDRETTQALVERGWMVLRIWEHVPPGDAADQVERAVSSPTLNSPGE